MLTKYKISIQEECLHTFSIYKYKVILSSSKLLITYQNNKESQNKIDEINFIGQRITKWYLSPCWKYFLILTLNNKNIHQQFDMIYLINLNLNNLSKSKKIDTFLKLQSNKINKNCIEILYNSNLMSTLSNQNDFFLLNTQKKQDQRLKISYICLPNTIITKNIEKIVGINKQIKPCFLFDYANQFLLVINNEIYIYTITISQLNLQLKSYKINIDVKYKIITINQNINKKNLFIIGQFQSMYQLILIQRQFKNMKPYIGRLSYQIENICQKSKINDVEICWSNQFAIIKLDQQIYNWDQNSKKGQRIKKGQNNQKLDIPQILQKVYTFEKQFQCYSQLKQIEQPQIQTTQTLIQELNSFYQSINFQKNNQILNNYLNLNPFQFTCLYQIFPTNLTQIFMKPSVNQLRSLFNKKQVLSNNINLSNQLNNINNKLQYQLKSIRKLLVIIGENNFKKCNTQLEAIKVLNYLIVHYKRILFNYSNLYQIYDDKNCLIIANKIVAKDTKKSKIQKIDPKKVIKKAKKPPFQNNQKQIQFIFSDFLPHFEIQKGYPLSPIIRLKQLQKQQRQNNQKQ